MLHVVGGWFWTWRTPLDRACTHRDYIPSSVDDASDGNCMTCTWICIRFADHCRGYRSIHERWVNKLQNELVNDSTWDFFFSQSSNFVFVPKACSLVFYLLLIGWSIIEKMCRELSQKVDVMWNVKNDQMHSKHLIFPILLKWITKRLVQVVCAALDYSHSADQFHHIECTLRGYWKILTSIV